MRRAKRLSGVLVVTPTPTETSEVVRAIAIIEDSRQTHVTWRDWLAAGNAEPHPDIGDVAWHQTCIDEYDHVLGVLRNLL